MTIEETLRDLETATRSRDRASLHAALAMVGATRPEDPEHRAVLLHFLSTFAHRADLAGVDAEALSSALQHASRAGAFNGVEQMQLLDIHRTLLNRAQAARLRDIAVAVATAATACAALSEADRAMLLALLLKAGWLDFSTVDLLKRFDASPYRQSLLRALEQGHADLAAAASGDAEAVRLAAEWALAQDAQAAWARKALAAALNRRGEFHRAMDAIAGLVNDADAATLKAWALFGKRRFDEAAACLPPRDREGVPNQQLAKLLRMMIAKAAAFESASPLPFHTQAATEVELDELCEAQDAVAMLGPTALFVAGGLLAQAGRLHQSIEFRQRAVEREAAPGRTYGLIQLLQLAGWWEAAGAALESAPRSSPAMACLWLQQAQHDYGRVTLQELADLTGQAGEPLIRARFSILAQEPCEYVAMPTDAPREVAEETLRGNLALAVRSRDLVRLGLWMDEPLFHLLPAPETECYRGVQAWLEGDNAIAGQKLARALELAPGFLPTIRCLAAVRADQGNHQAAGALWDRVTKLAPNDGMAFVHRALQFNAAGRSAEGIASLRNYCARAPRDELALYCLARLGLSAAFRRAAGAANPEWEAVERPTSKAAAILERLTPKPEVAWYAWVCKVIQIPSHLWPSRADTLIAAEPAPAHETPPMEAQWLRGHLRVLSGNFDTALAGMHLLAGFAGCELSAASTSQLLAAGWRLALRVASAEQAAGFFACVEPMAGTFSEIGPLLDYLATRFGICPRVAQGEGQPDDAQPSATIGNIRALLAAGDTVKLCGVFDQLKGNAGRDEKGRLLAGILALELSAFAAFNQVAADAPEEVGWEVLKAVALAKQNHKDAVGAFCTLLQRAGAQNLAWPTHPRLAGVFAFVSAKSRKHVRNRVLETLTTFPLEAVADHEIALNFLRANFLAGEFQRPLRLFESHRHLLTDEIYRELRRARYHEAARAIQTGDYARAATLIGEMTPESAEEAVANLGAIHERAQQLAAVAALLERLSPHPNLRADASRYRGLADLLDGEQKRVGRLANASARDHLRNRLADCRRNRLAAQWQAHFRSLAILHWEWGLAAMKLEPPLSEAALECFRFANYLWRHLLTDVTFWTNFAAESALSAAEAEAVRERIEAEIFDCHREQANLYLVASDAEGCRFHLSCLQGWERPPMRQYLTPESVSPRAAEGFSPAQAEALNARASAAFETWVDQVLWRARRLRDDPAAQDRLPPGIKCDYQAAIKTIGEALDAVPDHPRLCMFLIEQHADWAFGLVGAERRQEARDKLRPAIPIARRIANEKFRGKRLTGPDGDLIRRVFDYACKLEPDDQLLIPLLREYLHWNGPDADAERRLRLEEACAATDYDTVIERLEPIRSDRQAEALLVQAWRGRGLEQLGLGEELAGYESDDRPPLLDLPAEDRRRRLAEAGARFRQAEADFAAAASPQQAELQDLLEIARRRLRWLQTPARINE